MSDFTKFWLDTAALQSASHDCFPLESDLYLKAAELTEPCYECGCARPSETECSRRDGFYCERHEHDHHCEAVELLRAYEQDREQEAVGREEDENGQKRVHSETASECRFS